MPILENTKQDELIRRYLRFKSPYGDAIADVLTKEQCEYLRTAVDYFYGMCGDMLDVNAVSSMDTDTQKIYAQETELLFRMLDRSVINSGKDKDYVVTGFDPGRAQYEWSMVKSRMDRRVLRDVHAELPNLDIPQKFLLGKLHDREWLTESDLQRVLANMGLGNRVIINTANNMDDGGKNIGTMLHFRRRECEAHDIEKYTVPLILNVGRMGDIQSQGSHWVSAMINVDAKNKKISVTYQDSINISAEERKRIRDYLRKMLQYKEISNVSGSSRLYQAYTDYTLDDNDIVIREAAEQKDSWNCGYRALKNLIDLPDFPVDPADNNNPLFSELKALPLEQVTSEKLRKICYKAILHDVVILPELANKYNLHHDVIASDKIENGYLDNYLSTMTAAPKAKTSGGVTPQQLKELRQIQLEAEKYHAELEKKYVVNGNLQKPFIVNLADIITPSASLIVNKARINALIKFIGDMGKQATFMEITNPMIIPLELKDYFNDRFNQITNVKYINRCDFIVSNTRPDENTRYPSGAAYVRYDGELYYINSVRHEFKKIALKDDDLIKFDKVMRLSRELTAVELEKIKKINWERKEGNIPYIAINLTPQAGNLDAFPLPYNEAYVFSNEKIYYINREKNICEMVRENISSANTFNDIYTDDYLFGTKRHIKLDTHTLDVCEKITGNKHEPGVDAESGNLFDSLAARNRFMETVNISVDPEEDPWLQIWQKRFANGGMCRDILHNYGVLTISTSCPGYKRDAAFVEKLNEQVYQMADRYLASMLEFIDDKKDYFEMRGAKLPYQALAIGYDNPVQEKIKCPDYAALNDRYLETLARHCNAGRYFPFTMLEVRLHDFTDSNFDNLLRLFTALAKYPHVNTIDLLITKNDQFASLTDAQFQRLSDVYKSEKIKFTFRLKNNNYDSSVYQSEQERLDRLSLLNQYADIQNIVIRNKRHEQQNYLRHGQKKEKITTTAAMPVEKMQRAVIDEKSIRPFKRTDYNARENLNTEISAEAEQQHQLVTHMQHETQIEAKVDEQPSNEITKFQMNIADAALISRNDYITKHSLSDSLLAGLVPQCSSFMSGNYVNDVSQIPAVIWDRIIGKHNMPHNIKYMTAEAASKIHAAPQHYLYGINMDNPGTGFFLQESKDGMVLCYDETKYTENKNASPLTDNVNIKYELPSRWQGDIRGLLPDSQPAQFTQDEMLTFDNSVAHGTHIFPTSPDTAKLGKFMVYTDDEATADRLLAKHAWALPLNTVPKDFQSPDYNYNDFNTKSRLYLMMDIVHQAGCDGLEVFLDAMKELRNAGPPELFTQFVHLFIDRNQQPLYMSADITSKESIESIKYIARLPNDQKIWWMTLLEQHKNFNVQFDLVELAKGFQHFINKLPANCLLPIPCPIVDCNNMLTGLDRLLGILGRVRGVNLPDQMVNLNFTVGLNLDQEGPWYAARWEGFHYFHAAMELKPDKIDINFETAHLKRNVLTYKVTLEDLLRLSNANISEDDAPINNFDYPLALFHRFLGGADVINPKYQNYIDLTEKLRGERLPLDVKLQILPLLAIATTGVRGAVTFDPVPLFEYLQMNSSSQLMRGIKTLNERIGRLPVQPTLSELLALMHLMRVSSKTANEILDLMTPQMTDKTLKAVECWFSNNNRISADKFLELYKGMRDLDISNTDSFAKITASLRGPISDADINALIAGFAALYKSQVYKTVLNVLKSIDISVTPSDALPTPRDLIRMLNDVRNKSARDIPIMVQTAFPGCRFNLARGAAERPADLGADSQDVIDTYNDFFVRLGQEPIDAATLVSRDAAKQIQDRLRTMEPYAIDNVPVPSIIPAALVADAKQTAWDLARDKIAYKQIMYGLKEILNAPLAKVYGAHASLYILSQCEDLFGAEPVMSGKFDDIGKDFVEARDYFDLVKRVIFPAAALLDKWSGINLEQLIVSSRTRQFGNEDTAHIMQALLKVETEYAPNELVKVIFENSLLSEDVAANSEELTKRICAILAMNELNITERSNLIGMITKSRFITDVTAIDNLLKFVANHPKYIKQGVAIFSTIHDGRLNGTLTKAPSEMMALADSLLKKCCGDEELETIVMNRLARCDNLEYLWFLNEKLESFPASSPLIRMIAYSCFADESTLKKIRSGVEAEGTKEKEIFDDQGISAGLIDFSQNKADLFRKLLNLYQEPPYPRYARLKEFLKLKTSDEFDRFIEQFQFDPFGYRMDRKKYSEQFDRSTVPERIDGIVDLIRGKHMFHSQRKVLRDNLAYVNSIGIGNRYQALNTKAFLSGEEDITYYKLSVPGSMPRKDKLLYQIPVRKLTKTQIQELIQHYRGLISSSRTTDAEKRIAQLEFAAIAREAMYRATGQFAYSTQMLVLLNVMEQGGNIQSEVLTGEGKTLTSALLAAYKWMEGGSFDVATANKELATRDLAENAPFYEYLGIKTALINSESNRSDYVDGVNYGDGGQLALFHQKMQLQQKKMPDKISCLIDESDFIMLDMHTQFRYAAILDPTLDPHINPNAWVYSYILDFVERPEFVKDLVSRKTDIEKLRKYILALDAKVIEPKYKNLFLKFSDAQLDKWIDSAYTASKLIKDEDFVIRSTILNINGQAVEANIARVKIKGRESMDSSYSDGVHQFLHARLRRSAKQDKANPDYPIEQEKTYLASWSTKNLIDYYINKKNGNVLGLSGTIAATKKEIKELRKNYGFKMFRIPPHMPLQRIDFDPVLTKPVKRSIFRPLKVLIRTEDVNLNNKDTFYLTNDQSAVAVTDRWKLHYISRKGERETILLRNVYGLEEYLNQLPQNRLPDKKEMKIINNLIKEHEADEKGKYKQILANAKASVKAGMSVLSLCESVHTSDKLYRYLGRKLKLDSNGIQLYNGEQKTQERDVVAKGGNIGMITVSNTMFGRGTNIKPQGTGLSMLGTYISPFRDYGQEIGRSGRQGKYGESRLIISAHDLKRHGITDIPSYKDTTGIKKAINRVRNKLNHENEMQRRERQAFSDVKNQYQNFFNELMVQTKAVVKGNEIRATGFACKPVWKSMSKELFILREQFLKNIDTFWQNECSEIYNILKTDPHQSQKKLIKDAIARLVVHANKAWENQGQEIVSQAKTRLQAEFEAFKAKTDTASSFDIENYLEKISYTPQAAKLSVTAPRTPEEVLADISAKMIASEPVNEMKIYTDISGNINEEMKYDILHTELDTLLNKLVTPDRAEIIRKNSADSKVKHILEAILNGIYFSWPHNSAYADRLYQMQNQLADIVGKYGNDKCKEQAYIQYQEHLIAHRDSQKYTNYMIKRIYSFHTLNMFKHDADLSYIKLIRRTESEEWDRMCNFVVSLMNEYKSGCFKFISKDRKDALATFSADFNFIKKRMENEENREVPLADKIAEIVAVVNRHMSELVKTDYIKDISRAHSLFMPYRNVGHHSRFSKMLESIHAKCMTYVVSDQYSTEHHRTDISTLIEMLKILHQRAILPNVKNNPAIQTLYLDGYLIDLIERLNENVVNPDDMIECKRNLALIESRLQIHKWRIQQAGISSSSMQAFNYYLDGVLDKLSTFISTEQNIEFKLRNTDKNYDIYNGDEDSLERINDVYGSKEAILRARVQRSMYDLLHANDVSAVKMVRYANLPEIINNVNESDENIDHLKNLARHALYEIERNVKALYLHSKSIRITNSMLNVLDSPLGVRSGSDISSNNHLSANVEIMTQDGKKIQLNITINSFTSDPERADFVNVNWPNNPNKDLQPVRSNRQMALQQ